VFCALFVSFVVTWGGPDDPVVSPR
jgi:hypothetical protein